MKLKKFRWVAKDDEFPEEAWQGLYEIAGRISRDANNNTTSKSGFKYEDDDFGDGRVVRLGPTGAAAYSKEFGTFAQPASRPFKRALSKNRIG